MGLLSGVLWKKNKKDTKKLDFFELGNLNTKNDFIRARANSDSTALKKKFSNEAKFVVKSK